VELGHHRLPLKRPFWLGGRGLFRRFYPVLAELWRLLDIAVATGMLFVISLIYHGHLGVRHMLVAALTGLLMLVVYTWTDTYFRVRTKTLRHVAQHLLQAWGMVYLLLLAIGYIIGPQTLFPRELVLLWGVSAYLGQLVTHALIRVSLRALRRRGFNIREVLLVGHGDSIGDFAQLLAANPWLGIKIAGYVTDPAWMASSQRGAPADLYTGPARAAQYAEGLLRSAPAGPENQRGLGSQSANWLASPPLLGSMGDISNILQSHQITEIFITLPLRQSQHLETLTKALLNLPISISWVPQLSMVDALSQRAALLDGQPILALSDSPLRGGKRTLKRFEDIVLSALMLPLLSPLLLFIALTIKATSKGPVLFKQQRYGVGGKPIVVWKFRTMHTDAGGEIPRQAAPLDNRITPIGHFLRRWSLDELPQLLNVLQGRMSMVGPRPHPVWLDNHYKHQICAYMQRYRVLPGITGWAQVNGLRGETDTVDKMELRLKQDLYYVNHWSLWFDLKIMLQTVLAVLRGKNAY